jgi:serine/threonine-protein kinase
MKLTPQDVALLNRLSTAALAIPAGERETWLRARPVSQQPLVPHLRTMLEALQASTSDDLTAALPALPAIGDDVVDGAGRLRAGDAIGPYRLIELIGRGGMGRVWRAARADGLYEREVALKLPDLARGPELANRMAQERRIGARLEHPNIARLYDAGVDASGRPYLVMEWVRGLNLVEYADAHRLSRHERIGLLVQACTAVAHAHSQLVVHRDIKPANILVDESGQVKLLDFGVARWLATVQAEAQAEGIEPSSVEGGRGTHTPGYCAPEQRNGEVASTAMDVYALGVVAHRLLTGRLPSAPSALDAEARRQLGPDLVAVLECAMRSAPEARYSSVDRLADDLRRVIEGRPAAVSDATWLRRSVLFVRRHRRALIAGVSVVALVVATAGFAWQQHAREQQQAEREAQAREFMLEMLEDAEPMEGRIDGPVTAIQLVENAVQRARAGFPGQDALRGNVLSQLGLMFRRLEQPERALEVLEEAQGLLHASAGVDDPSLHIASAQLALQLLQASRPDDTRARQLATSALGGCTADSVRCARARLYAHDALRTVALRQANAPLAVEHARRAVIASERAFGSNDAEVAMTRLYLAQVLRNAGELQAAAEAMTQARGVAARTAMRAADRRELATWGVVLDSDLGRDARVIAEVRRMLSQPDAVDNPALLHRLAAQSLFARGRFAESRREAEAALATATAQGRDRQAALARQTLARTEAMLGAHAAARENIDRARSSLQDQGLHADTVERLRAQRVAGEIALHAGDDAQALALLQDLPARHRRAGKDGPVAPVDLALALDLLGLLERRAGRRSSAIRFHDEAGALLRAALPDDHPLRLRHDYDAAMAAGRGEAIARQRYLDWLPDDSDWRPLLAPAADDGGRTDPNP